MFADRAKIYVRSGKGGDGHVSFRREKYVPAGGPDGGDGGKGGDVIFVVDQGLNTLIDFRNVRKYKAQDGEPGGKRNCRGKDGSDIVLKVPPGTVIKEAASGQVIVDMSGDNRQVTLLKGGRGGSGNQHYATSTMQAPTYAQPGRPAKELEILLELKVIADVGLVGLPNVGKSTFLARVTNAKPKIANYHFTTLNPNLGVVDLDGTNGFVIADIPGLIEGASEGIGLGHGPLIWATSFQSSPLSEKLICFFIVSIKLSLWGYIIACKNSIMSFFSLSSISWKTLSPRRMITKVSRS